jgi:1,4-alpha-glucan branching enzyme
LSDFDREMISFAKKSKLIENPEINWLYDHKGNEILIYSRGKYLFVFNFHPSRSFTDYGIPMHASKYKIVLDTDDDRFGGQNRIDRRMTYFTVPESSLTSQHYLRLYLPARTAFVMEKQEFKRVR